MKRTPSGSNTKVPEVCGTLVIWCKREFGGHDVFLRKSYFLSHIIELELVKKLSPMNGILFDDLC